MWTKIIQLVAEQLTLLFGDYDVAYKVSEIYVQKRIHDSIEYERRYHATRQKDYHFIFAHNDEFKNNIQYLTSEKGVRCHYWRVSAATWGIKNLIKINPSLKDKLDDLKHIPVSLLRGGAITYYCK
jgi:hypothetical protein